MLHKGKRETPLKITRMSHSLDFSEKELPSLIAKPLNNHFVDRNLSKSMTSFSGSVSNNAAGIMLCSRI